MTLTRRREAHACVSSRLYIKRDMLLVGWASNSKPAVLYRSLLVSTMSTSSRDSLVLGRVIGDVIDHFSPAVALQISYNGRRLLNGADFRPSAVAARPRVDVGGTDLRQSYTLVIK
jgi:protein FLOWERING LOCUS T